MTTDENLVWCDALFGVFAVLIDIRDVVMIGSSGGLTRDYPASFNIKLRDGTVLTLPDDRNWPISHAPIWRSQSRADLIAIYEKQTGREAPLGEVKQGEDPSSHAAKTKTRTAIMALLAERATNDH